MGTTAMEQRAQQLCQRLADGVTESNLCSLTDAIYDTAWLAMVSKADGGEVRWLFPESFKFILDQQLPGGGWASYATKAYGILNTLAALLALVKHQNGDQPNESLQAAIRNAVAYLDAVLQTLDLDGNLSVGFEILVPAMLEMLESQGGVHFALPARGRLLELQATRMEAFRPDLLYYNTVSTLSHSLEALVGKIDFDRIRHRKIFGSMMASPASTAAYLMNATPWDEEAEMYLRKAVKDGPGKGNGAVPSAFPTPIFEISWTISTLLQSGYSTAGLGHNNMSHLASYLQKHYTAQNGLVGFAPLIQADADDSSRVAICLSFLGYQVETKPQVVHFRSDLTHFHTYINERDASFSANCNVLRAMLESGDFHDHFTRIEIASQYLCELWWNGRMEDKWNTSPQYSMMLLAETLVKLLELWDRGHLTQLSTAFLQNRLSVTLIQLATRTLNNHNFGTARRTEGSTEILAYAILTLKALYSLPWVGTLSEELLSRVRQGQEALSSYSAVAYEPQYVWVEKVTYGSFSLTEAYSLAAMHPTKPTHVWTAKVKNLVPAVPAQEKITHMFGGLRCFESEPAWKIRACVLEGLAFLPQLRSSCQNILAGEKTAKNEYLSFIPCTWVVINNIRKLDLETYLLWDMMVLTLSNFRVDEWMETATRGIDVVGLLRAKDNIRSLCKGHNHDEHARIKGTRIDTVDPKSLPSSPDRALPAVQQATNVRDFASLHAALSPYISTVLEHPRTDGSSSSYGASLRADLGTFLNSHIDQAIANLSFSAQASPSVPFEDFSNWLRTISTPSVSAHFSFTFLTGLMDGLPPDPGVRYLSQEFSACVAGMSRMYNDLGSLARDMAEQNLNCSNFFLDGSIQEKSKFNGSHAKGHLDTHHYVLEEGTHAKTQLARAKARLETLAAYERDAAGLAGARLISALLTGDGCSSSDAAGNGLFCSRRKRMKWADAVRLFLGVAELYADLYLVKDLSNRQQQQDGEDGRRQGRKRKRE
ncbi:MAG: hypothetical protein LQ348_001827 [Seirophora lacunosa]|nr:MAG: hypothetical protein LQ348_001827 [Seirophora lacunosa]